MDNSAIQQNDKSLYQKTNIMKPENKSFRFKIVIIAAIFFGIFLLIIVIFGIILLFSNKGETDETTNTTLKPSITTTTNGNSGKDQEDITSNTDNTLQNTKFYIDTDKDGFPDYVEIGSGYDPLKNDCLLELNCGDVPGITLPDNETNILLILDASSSMADKSGGVVKMDAAKEALKSYIDEVHEDFNVGFMVYGHKGEAGLAGKAESCVDPEILVPIQKVDKELLKQKVDSFNATGWTPIAGSLKLAENAFKGMEGDYNKIILVSDGEESCEGNPCSSASVLKASGINVVIDTVGFDVNQTAKDQLKCIAEVTGGQYFYANSSDELVEYFDKKAEEAQKWAEAQGCIALNLNKYVGCIATQYGKSIEYINTLNAEALSNGDHEEFSQNIDVLERISVVYKGLVGGSLDQYDSQKDELND